MTIQNVNQRTSAPIPSARQQTRQRHQALRALCHHIDQNPSSVDAGIDAALSDFTSLDDLLAAAHAAWARTFEARMDMLLESGAYGDQVAFDALWDATARDLGGLAVLLDHFRDHPAVTTARGVHARRVRNALAVDLPGAWAPTRAAA